MAEAGSLGSPFELRPGGPPLLLGHQARPSRLARLSWRHVCVAAPFCDLRRRCFARLVLRLNMGMRSPSEETLGPPKEAIEAPLDVDNWAPPIYMEDFQTFLDNARISKLVIV